MPRGPRKAKSTRKDRLSSQYYYLIYHLATLHGVSTAAAELDLHPYLVTYWKNKFEIAHFHSSTYGGARKYKWHGEDLHHLRQALWTILQLNPLAGISDFQNALAEEFDYPPELIPSSGWLSEEFKRWGWSFTKPDYRQIHKYTKENIQYYCTYLYNIQNIAWDKIKFADESHFDSRGMIFLLNKRLFNLKLDLRKIRALSPIGENTQVLVKGPISKRYTMTLLTTLSHHIPVVISFRDTSNTSTAFFEYVQYLVEQNYLQNGDYFVIDNAPVHKAEDMLGDLLDLLEENGIQLIFLPTYSPELNPCELCFSYIKRHLRENYEPQKSLEERIVDACCNLQPSTIRNFYEKCIIKPLYK